MNADDLQKAARVAVPSFLLGCALTLIVIVTVVSHPTWAADSIRPCTTTALPAFAVHPSTQAGVARAIERFTEMNWTKIRVDDYGFGNAFSGNDGWSVSARCERSAAASGGW